MLIYWSGRLFYSETLVWLTALALAASPVAAWYAWDVERLLPPELPLELLLPAIDWSMATALVGGVTLPWLRACFLTSGRLALYLLRCASAVLAAAALAALCVEVMPRRVLALSLVVYIAISLNLSCWTAELWLYLQNGGLGGLLPGALRRALFATRPIEVLATARLDVVIARYFQLCALLLLPADERADAVRMLPEPLRSRLEQRGLLPWLPTEIAQVLAPWAHGPDFLRVDPLFGAPRNGLDAAPRAHSRRRPPADPHRHVAAARAVPPPSWLMLYALRRRAVVAVRGQLDALDPTHVRVGALALAAALYLRIASRHGGVHHTTASLAAMVAPIARRLGATAWRGQRPLLLLALLALCAHRVRTRPRNTAW